VGESLELAYVRQAPGWFDLMCKRSPLATLDNIDQFAFNLHLKQLGNLQRVSSFNSLGRDNVFFDNGLIEGGL